MSLNGLGDPSILEAYEKAASEPGGWFLLEYASRDEVKLLGRGTGGAVEMRNAIASYEDPSPLFGFLLYRRRKVVLKFVPAECSRLVQARVTVHFSAITDQFSPHDTTFSISSPKELRDTALSAACCLHTATGSASSSTSSLRRRRLMEISEEEEEEIRAKRESKDSELSGGVLIITQDASISETSTSISNKDGSLSSKHPPWPIEKLNSLSSRTDSDYQLQSRSRTPSQSMQRDSLKSAQTCDYSVYGKSKVRLGPRPSQDVGSRPYTSGAPCRSVCTLPAGIKSFAKGSKIMDRSHPLPKSADGSDSRSSLLITPPLISAFSGMNGHETLIRPHSSGKPSFSSSISYRPIPSPTFSLRSKLPPVDSARARLMKAQEMRKKKIEIAKALDSNLPQIDHVSRPEMTPPASPIATSENESSITTSGNDFLFTTFENEPSLAILHDLDKPPDLRFPIEACLNMRTDDSDSTLPESLSGLHAESTRASSIVESIQAVAYDSNTNEHTVSPEKLILPSPSPSQSCKNIRPL